MSYKDYLNDTSFLKDIAGLHIKEYFVKITVLDWQQEPIEDIQGKVVSASINIDGNSIIRRTANISMIVGNDQNNITNANNLISINKKINLQIGFKNTTNQYLLQEYLWFPLGVYVITDSSLSYSDTGLTISIQLKDKMCLLNGECGGTLPASVVFDNFITTDQNGQEIISRPTIYQIIQELVNHFGGEQLGKIIISDLDIRVKQAVKWTGSSPIYICKKNQQYFYTLNPDEQSEEKVDWPKKIFQYGEDIGYIYIDFTYPGDLIGDAGNTVTDILEKIKEVLGNYEYFYDINGNFVFQQIKNYLNNAQSKYILDALNENKLVPDYIDAQNQSGLQAYLIDINNGTSAFSFNDSNLVLNYNNSPKYGDIRNDFVVWGVRTTSEGYEIPLRYHLAIDSKPKIGNKYKVFQYIDESDGIEKWYYPITFDSKDNFPSIGAAGTFYYDGQNIYKWGQISGNDYDYITIDATLEEIQTTDWRTQLYFQGLVANVLGTESNYYFAELYNEWPLIYDIRQHKFFDQVINNPTQINFFLDFIDAPASAISELNVNNIGRRTKVFNEDKNVNCVFQAWIPDLILISSGWDSKTQSKIRNECIERGQSFYTVSSEIYDTLDIGGVRYSAYQEIRQVIHQYTKYNETISLQTLPIYHLEPNTRITINNTESNIFGDYMIQSLSFSLDNSSSLTINAIKVPDKI